MQVKISLPNPNPGPEDIRQGVRDVVSRGIDVSLGKVTLIIEAPERFHFIELPDRLIELVEAQEQGEPVRKFSFLIDLPEEVLREPIKKVGNEFIDYLHTWNPKNKESLYFGAK